MKITARFRLQLLIQNGLFVALILGIATVLLIAAEKSNMRWDMTYSQRNTLSSETLDILQKIQGPISISAFVTTDADGDLRQPIIDFLTPYQLEKSDIQIRFIDPREDPFAAKQAGVSVNGELIISLGGRSDRLKSLNEQDLTNLLMRLMRTSQRSVTALTGHGEGDFARQGGKDLSDLAKKLSNKGFKLDVLNFASGDDIDPNESALIISAPTVALLPGEVKRVQRHLDNGLNMLWLVDNNSTGGLDQIADYLGIKLPEGIVIDPSARVQRLPASFALAQSYGDHAITKPMSVNTVFPYSRGILDKGSGSFSFTPLVEVAPDGWIETEGVKNATYDEARDIKGPAIIAAALEREIGEKRQRVVVVGSGRVFSNEYLASLGNADLVSNIVNWISGDDSLISIEPKIRMDMTLNLPPIAVSLIVSGFLFVLPLGLLLAGVIIWWRRRQA